MIALSIGIVVAFVALAIWWLLRPARPSVNEPLTPSMLRGLIDALLYQGLDGGELRIVTKDGPAAFRLIKYVRHAEGAGIVCEVSKVGGYGEHFHALLSELLTRGIRHELVNSPVDGVRVDFGRDTGQVHFVTVIFFERCLGVCLEADCLAYFNDKVLPIDSPLTGMTPRGRA